MLKDRCCVPDAVAQAMFSGVQDSLGAAGPGDKQSRNQVARYQIWSGLTQNLANVVAPKIEESRKSNNYIIHTPDGYTSHGHMAIDLTIWIRRIEA
jgi:hypothetical protein